MVLSLNICWPASSPSLSVWYIISESEVISKISSVVPESLSIPVICVAPSPSIFPFAVILPPTVTVVVKIAALALISPEAVMLDVTLPPIFKSVPINNFLAILAPPSHRNAPVSPVASDASPWPWISKTALVAVKSKFPSSVESPVTSTPLLKLVFWWKVEPPYILLFADALITILTPFNFLVSPNVISPATSILPGIVIIEDAPAPIVASSSPSASPSSITKPAVDVPSCSATDIVNLPPSWPLVWTLTCDLISLNFTWSWFASSPKNCISPLTSLAAPAAPLSFTKRKIAPSASFVVF